MPSPGQAAPAALTKLVLKSRVDLLGHAAPVGHGPRVDVVHLALVRVEAPVVASTEDVDLVLLSPPHQSCLHRGCREAQLHDRGRTRYSSLAVVNPVLRTWQRDEKGRREVRSILVPDSLAVNGAAGAGALAGLLRKLCLRVKNPTSVRGTDGYPKRQQCEELTSHLD